MRFNNVCLEAVEYTLPQLVLSSDEIERRLTPLYDRLRLPAGRLELMTGIRERRVWPAGTLPSTISAATARRAIENSRLPKSQIGALLHASVCRDFLEPATACRVHHLLELPAECLVFDISNACLGLMNGMLQIAQLIETGQISAGVVVGTESSGPLLDTTIAALNSRVTLRREDIKRTIASLTIGSGSAAIVLTHRSQSRTGNRLLSAAWRAETAHHGLCHSDRDETVGGGMQPLMETDSEQLMHQGIDVGLRTFTQFQATSGWSATDIDKTITHQVGTAHRRLMFQRLGLNPENDFATVEWLGNTGSVALPLTLALAAERGYLQPRDRVAMLGIGSGINALMFGLEWNRVPPPLNQNERQPTAVHVDEVLPAQPSTAAL